MSQREVEHLIGRLVTDEDFRDEFIAEPRRVLQSLVERGAPLSTAEVAALLATDANVWTRASQDLDPRLQKASLTMGRGHSTGAGDEGAPKR